jgi:hypothetical protein
MSGKKYTQVQLQRERQEKLDLLQSLQSLLAECTALRKQLEDQVNGMSEGLRSTFNAEVAASRQWLHGTTLVDTYSMDHRLDDLRQAQRRQEQITNAGRTCLKNLQLALTQKADAIGRAVAEQRVTVTQFLLQYGEVLRLWYGAEAVAAWESKLEQAAQWLDTDHYHEAEGQLSALHSELQAKASQATNWEAQHQRRLYLLKALRQVAADLHFTEITQPSFEKSGERGSRIVFSVDTHDRGRIDFHLTLDGLGSFSEMADNQCPVEFGTLSKQLDERFGIHTQFRPVTGESTPELRRKGEKERPDDGAQQTAATGGGN